MWIIQLLLAWMLLYVAFKLMIGIGSKRDKSAPPTGSSSGSTDSESGYFQNNPDALRPDIEDEMDPSDYV